MNVPAGVASDDPILQLPKVSLHDHLDGGLRPSTMIELADSIGHTLPASDAESLRRWFSESANSGDLVRYLETFSHTVAVMQSEDNLRRVAKEWVLDQVADGVFYAEARWAPEQHLEGGLELDAVVEAVQAGLEEGVSEAAADGKYIRVGQLITAMRQADNSLAIAELAIRHREKGADSGVVGFDIAGQPVQGRITNLRKVDWSSMRVNFFVLFEAADLPDLPATQIAAYRTPLTPAGRGLDRALARQFPNLTVIDVSAQLNQVQGVLDQVIQAVQFLFGFTLATGLVVLLAAVGSTREARTREFGLMRALGAPSSLLAQVQRAELLGVGALAGFLAGAVALLLAGLMARYVFQFEWQMKPWVPLASAAFGAVLAWGAGWWSLRGVLQRPVVQTLREAQAE